MPDLPVNSNDAQPVNLVDATNNTQVAVVDTNGFLTLQYPEGALAKLGKVFSIQVAPTITGLAETAAVLFKNPSGSGKTVYLIRLQSDPFVKNDNPALRMYHTPTVTANGTTVTPVNTNLGNSTTSIANVFTLPTVTSNGTIVQAVSATNDTLWVDFYMSRIIQPNNSILITETISTINTANGIFIKWAEF